MPARPPVYRRPGVAPRKAWERPLLFKDTRKRGRPGMRDRAAVLAEEPFCRICLRGERQVASDVVDHIVPMAWCGIDERWNKQALCHPCHDAKSLAERRAGPSADLKLRLRRMRNEWLATCSPDEPET